MRRQLSLVLFTLLATAALVSAQEPNPTPEPAEPRPPTATMHMVNGAYQPLDLEPVTEMAGPLATTAGPADDLCREDSTSILKINDGGITDVRNFTFQADDPVLACMWGDPPRPEGFRTAWYKFTPATNGTVTLSTAGSTYDTVLAVHTGICGALTPVACNDDDNYFTSSYDLEVIAGKTYYVEVADWQSSASGAVTLSLQTLLEPIDSQWETVSSGSGTEAFRSRHIVIAQGTKLYVMGGQTVVGNNPVRTPTVYAYNTANGALQHLPNMPGGSDGLGYSNTTAALVNGRIYIPAGYTGNDLAYDGVHLAFDIGSGNWLQGANLPVNNNWAGGLPAIYSQANSYNLGGSPGAGYFLSGGLTGPFPADDDSANWTPRPELYFYSAGLDQWSNYPDMPSGRFGHVAAVQTINGQKHLCVAGGIGGNPGTTREILGSTECYRINQGSQGTWSELGSLTYPRYFASSAVDPYGNWYVFGGYDETGKPIPFTERYDAAADEWVPLSAPLNVIPARAWTRGAYVGNDLWIVGGEAEHQQVVNVVQRTELVTLPWPDLPTALWLPLVSSQEIVSGRRYDTFATARNLPYNSSVQDRFYTADDLVNIYRFYVPSTQRVRLQLIHLGSGNSLDLVVYTENKGWVAEGRQPGTINENVVPSGPLSAGTYFVAVERIFPLPGFDPSSNSYLLVVGPA